MSDTAHARAGSHAGCAPEESSLLRRTLKMVAILVGACVLFVGTASVLAILIVTKAVGGAPKTELPQNESPTAKKPLSI